MRNKNLVQYMIEKRGAAKLTDTKPELFVLEVLKELGYTSFRNDEVHFLQDGKSYSFRPDFLLYFPNSSTYLGAGLSKLVIEVLGPYHYTDIEIRKTCWRSNLLQQMGYRVILICWQLCIKQHREYLKQQLCALIPRSDFGVYEIPV